MSDPFFFGYGSLVNRKTHAYPQAQPARVTGWRRIWKHTRLRKLAYLSVHPVAEARIAGLIAAVPGGDWQALDRRERAYRRVRVPGHAIDHEHPVAAEVHLYRTDPVHEEPPSIRHPVLLSYIDTVAAGFHDLFGEEGARAFFATTDGWDLPVLDDRRAPIYPRATAPSPALQRLVDAELDALKVSRRPPDGA